MVDAVPIDWGAVLDLFGVIDDRTLAQLKRFPALSRPSLDALRAAVGSGARQDALREAHSMKGAARNAGAAPLADACLRLEHALRQGRDPPPHPQLAELLAAVELQLERLSDYLATCSGAPAPDAGR